MLEVKLWVLAGVGGILFFMIISRSIKKPLVWLWQGLLYSAIGSLIIFLINFIGQSFHFELPINVLTAFVVGLLRIPGFMYLIAVKLFMFH